MKTEIRNEESSEPDINFPVLMKSTLDGAIVLFHAPKEGICLKAGVGDAYGEYSKKWKPFSKGTWTLLPPGTEVVLKND